MHSVIRKNKMTHIERKKNGNPGTISTHYFIAAACMILLCSIS